jgi:Uma2 family endonuclease
MTAMTVRQDTSRITADEFLSGVPGAPESYPIGSELVDGVVHLNDATFRHQELCGRLYDALRDWTRTESGFGTVRWGGNWVLGERQVYKPDVWCREHPPDGARHDGPPDLAVEVRSPGTWRLDIGRKRVVYGEAGTKELWLVDTPARTVLAFRAGAFDEGLEIGPGEQLTTPLLPGLAIPIDELFAE